MALHTKGRHVGTADKIPTGDWLVRETSTAHHESRQMVLSLVMSVIGRQLRVWVIGASWQPKETQRAPHPDHRGERLTRGMIRPSTHNRVSIASHRDDWP